MNFIVIPTCVAVSQIPAIFRIIRSFSDGVDKFVFDVIPCWLCACPGKEFASAYAGVVDIFRIDFGRESRMSIEDRDEDKDDKDDGIDFSIKDVCLSFIVLFSE